jgi:hypothetical protein
VTLLLLSSVEIFGNSLCPEAFFFGIQSIMRNTSALESLQTF